MNRKKLILSMVFFLILGIAAFFLKSNIILAGPGPHIYCETNSENVTKGDTFIVTLKTNEMNICTLTGGIRYDDSKVELIDIDETSVVFTSSDDEFLSISIEKGEDSNVGIFGVGFDEHKYEPATLTTLTFKAIAAGDAVFTLYESTDGTDGFNSDGYEGVTVTISEFTSETATTKGESGTGRSSETSGETKTGKSLETSGETKASKASESSGETKPGQALETQGETKAAKSSVDSGESKASDESNTSTEAAASETETSDLSGSGFPIWLPIAIVIVAAGIVATIILLKKRK